MRVLFLYENFPDFYHPYMEDQAYYLSKNPEVELDILSLKNINKRNLRYHFPSISFLQSSNVPLIRSLQGFARKVERQQKILVDKKLSPYNHLELRLLDKDYDILHIQQSYLVKMLPSLVKAKLKNKLVVTFRGGDTYIKPWIDKRWRELDLVNIAKNNVYCQVMSNNQKNYLMRWGIPSENIFIVPTGVNREIFFPAPKRKLSNEIQICSVFRFCWEKNVELNLRIIKALKDKEIPVKYHAFGNGPDLGQFFYWVDKLDLHDQVIYRGKVRPAQLNLEFQNLDFILQMSASESLGTSILEAQACGIPAIVSDSGGLPETIIQGETGFSLPYGDIDLAVEKIMYLTDENVYNKFRQRCISFIEKNFTNQVEVSKIINMYKSFLEKVN